VVALLKELGASKKLATMIEGESLFNDGTAMVVFLIMLEINEGEDLSFGEMVGKFARLSFGGPVLGLLFGILVDLILQRIHNNYVLEVNLTIVAAYMCWFIAENTAVHVSGILAIVALGLYMTHSGKTSISVESEHALHHVWGYVGYCAETLIFMLAGMVIGMDTHRLRDDGLIDNERQDTLLVIANYGMAHVIRFSMIMLFWPLLNRLGYGMSFKQVLLGSYAGLRGAVGLALALIVKASPEIDDYIKDILLYHVGGVAVLTLLINAPTTGMLVKALGLTDKTDIQKQMLTGVTT
jgi:NhaP-type Na+/H+ or K+/H+ antiporter